jgi:maleate isomerase
MPDTLGYRKKIALIVPAVNAVVQPECDAMRPAGVTNHIGRIDTPNANVSSDAAFLRHVEGMRAGIHKALDQIMSLAPDFIVMALSLEAFWEGVAGAEAMLRRIEALTGVPCNIGSSAILRALETYAAADRPIRSLALITPHRPMGDAKVRAFFEEAGFGVAKLFSFNCYTPRAIAEVSIPAMRQAIAKVNGPDIDAIVQTGTNLPMTALCAEAEAHLGKPVIGINAATYWDALRRAGIPDRVPGWGRLLAEH